ncbi:MAG: glucosaminidase domain-containing protein [Marinoscillum sp.]|uniref:glucosaminidase domain-containing protein n=1 Tax=Marinoscillum sp. TaxID=2024838 RepID=UPI0032F39F16
MQSLRFHLIPFSLLGILACSEPPMVMVLSPTQVAVQHADDILVIDDTLVKPVLYHNLPHFEELPVEESKAKFIGAVLPAILIAKFKIDSVREEVKALTLKKKWNHKDSALYMAQSERFRAKSTASLLDKMRTHPNSIVLAQAIVESGWGSSRFFQEANNLFGIWSYNTSEPRIAAGKSRNGTRIFLRKYENISESIVDYFETVARAQAYRHFREARKNTNEVTSLVPYLRYYSERRDEYVEQLQTIIRQNDLTRYDGHQLDPAYFIAKTLPK